MVRKLLLSVVSVAAFFAAGHAQNRPVSGTVSNQEGAPMIGVVVTVQGTTTSNITDGSGRYSISAPATGILEFSSFGMETLAMPIENRTTVDVTMSYSMTNIDDVIVVAYGLATREAFTGAATMLGGEDISKRQVSNVSKALSGAVAGVQAFSTSGRPGESADIRIRGVGSISSSNEPLYVLDGVPFEGDVSSINPQDIESMSVLKDASAAAIYGARGANGVILVTTKRGTSRDAVVTVDARVGINQRGVPQYEVMTDPGMYFETLYQSLYNSYASNNATTQYSPSQMNVLANNRLFSADGGTGFRVYTTPEGQQLIGTNGKLNPAATLGWNDGEYYYQPDDFYKESFGMKPIRQEYNVSVSGASDKINYFLSGGYLKDTGFIPSSGFERYTTRLKADYQVKSWLRTTANISYTNTTTDNPGDQEGTSSANVFYMSNVIAPVYPFYVRDTDGNILIDGNGLTVYEYGDGRTSNQTRTYLPGAHPYGGVQLNYSRTNFDIFSGRWGIVADIVQGLRLQANLGLDVEYENFTRMDNKYYGQYAASGGYVWKEQDRTTAITQNYLLTYNKSWGEHNIDALVGYENYRLDMGYIAGSREKYYNPNNHELDNAISNHFVYSGRDRYSLLGVLSRVQYDYAGKYFLSASYRRDASSRFHPDNRWGDFGSVGAAWIVSGEDFFNVRQFDLLKLKASWGMQGNDAILTPDRLYHNYYPYADQYTLSESDGAFATTLSQKGNPDITWETSLNFNAGVEFDMFGGRLGGNIEYFNRKTIDLLYNQPVAPSAGYSTIPMNLGTMRNSGVEVDLYGTILATNNLTWSVNANGTFVKNKILALAEDEIIEGSRRYAVGGSFYNMYLREYAGVAQEAFTGKDAAGADKSWQAGQALYWMQKTNADGNPYPKELTDDWASAKQYDTGSLMPKLYGGFGTTVSFYGFDVSAQFAYQLGGKIVDVGYQTLMHTGRNSNGMNWHMDALGAWSESNQSETTPRLNMNDLDNNRASTRFLTSSDYLSINNVTVGYTVPSRLTQRIDVSSLRIYFSADNLAVMSARKGLDPRQVLAGATDNITYSAIRSLSGGITISF
jgi:TonB-linked SusC/RagA family outer membrane protein